MENQNNDYLSLLQLNLLIKQVLQDNFLEDVWVVAEIAELKTASSGHCYLELVEKKNDKFVARIKANIWARQFEDISLTFFHGTGSLLANGMKVLLSASVGFHEVYGVSLTVKAIDPSYTLGELAKQKQLVIQKLESEGLLQKNKRLELALLPKRIAIISSKTAAGFEDFYHQLQNNSLGYCFELTLFEAVLQGEKAKASIIAAVNEVTFKKDHFDCVVIIRGGGASLDFSPFDDYEVNVVLASCSLPVLTGIGHERDDTVADLVAHTRLKTPTAVAAFLIQQFEEFEQHITEIRLELIDLVQQKIAQKNQFLERSKHFIVRKAEGFIAQQKLQLTKKTAFLQKEIPRLLKEKDYQLSHFKNQILFKSTSFLKDQRYNLLKYENQLPIGIKNLFFHQQKHLQMQTQKLTLLDPKNVLKRGFALVRGIDGNIIMNLKNIQKQQEVQIEMQDGSIKMNVKNEQ